MEKQFFLVELTSYVDSTKDSYGVYAYDTENDAVAAFHQKLSGAMKNANYAFELCQVVNQFGVVIKSECFERPASEE